jgi:SulP family sulfate permease
VDGQAKADLAMSGISSDRSRDGAPGSGGRRRSLLPILTWLPHYSRETLSGDLLAAVIVTIMLIPQSLAYAMLAGVPPEMGLYASIAPLVAYAVFGTSNALAVGPVAVVSLMTAAALGDLAAAGSALYMAHAVTLALLSGVMLVALGLFRLGFLANFLSHPVISGFMTASAILIAASQLRPLLGIEKTSQSWWPDPLTASIGVAVLAFLYWVRIGLKPLLLARGIGPRISDIIVRAAPVFAVVVTTLGTWGGGLHEGGGVAIVGAIPQGLPPITLPELDLSLLRGLAQPALLISIVGFVESVSVAQTLAAKRRERIDPDQELIGLGAANIGSSLTGGFPVTGGFARSSVNFEAGARTPAAGAFTAVGILLASLLLTPLLHFLPKATLAATIIVAVVSLVDWGVVQRSFSYSKSDFSAMVATIGGTLVFGVEAGIMTGVALSLLLLLYRASRPHIAIVGQVPGTEHFRNVLRHTVRTNDKLLCMRIDESLTFVNARYLEDAVLEAVASHSVIEHIVLMCSAVNHVDGSALESLEAINVRLRDAGIAFHLSEVKGPVMDRLRTTSFLEHLTGRVFLSQNEAFRTLTTA